MTSDYQIWLTANGEKETMMLPVNPTKFQVKCGSNNDHVNVVGLGEITVMQGRPALQITFSSFFPATYFPGCKVRTPSLPLLYVARIKQWMESDKPIHLIVTQCGIDMYCTIEDFPYSENGGDVGTYAYTLTLKEYREVSVRKVKIADSTATVPKSSESRVDNTVQSQTYTVKKGDCLWNIAKKFYGNGSEYIKIYNANKEVIGGNPNLIYAGQVLTIPA